MSNEQKKPKLEFLTNIPKTFRVVKMFSEGTNKYGKKWYGYDVQCGGEEQTLFAVEKLHEKLKSAEGRDVTVTLTEIPMDGGKKKNEYAVDIVTSAPAQKAQSSGGTGPTPNGSRDYLILRQVAMKGAVELISRRSDIFEPKEKEPIIDQVTDTANILLDWLMERGSYGPDDLPFD